MREIPIGVAMAGLLFTSGCAGLIDPETPVSAPEAGSATVDAQASTIPDVYGAKFLGDADQCATVVCSGAQVCCVVPIASGGPHEHPNNRCDYDCTARCMDSCPPVSPASMDAASSPGSNGLSHGGPLLLAADDGGRE